LQRGIPIRCAHDDLGPIFRLQFRRTLIVIAMRMADDDVLEVVRVQAELGSPSMISG
jgi:hypothetical protein